VEHYPEQVERWNDRLITSCGTSADDDGDWAPPTDAESKVLAARRERQEKVSKLLGEYLLKGYKMLGSTCPTCDVSQLLRSSVMFYWSKRVSELSSNLLLDLISLPCSNISD
jgi:hypothetical protein